MLEILLAASAGILGIFAGAQIAEGVLFVPYWKALKPADFFRLHQTYGKKIHQFFAPLTIAATLIPLATAGYTFWANAPEKIWIGSMAIFTLLFFSTYFLFFKKANQSFAEENISHEELPAALVRWGNWHWARIWLELAALVCVLVALAT